MSPRVSIDYLAYGFVYDATQKYIKQSELVFPVRIRRVCYGRSVANCILILGKLSSAQSSVHVFNALFLDNDGALESRGLCIYNVVSK